MLQSYLKQDDKIKLHHKISFVTSFTISKWLKKYYIMLKSYVKQDNIVPPPPHNIILVK